MIRTAHHQVRPDSSPAPLKPRRSVRTLTLAACLAICAVSAGGTAAGTTAGTAGDPTPAARSSATPVSTRPVTMRMPDGTRLRGMVAEPTTPGPHPLIVMPAAGVGGEVLFLRTQRVLAEDGYVHLFYHPRGKGPSGARMAVARPQEIADVSQVIDWALAHTGADPHRIGVTGVSYGAGTSLLAAAADPRIDAVAAMSTWTDMADVLRVNGTRTTGAPAIGLGVSLADRPDPSLGNVAHSYLTRNHRAMTAWARPRSPISYVDRINAHGTAVFIAQPWRDSLTTTTDQLGAFFDRLRGVKRLELRPGDHGGPELTAVWQSNEVFRSVHRWFDHLLKDQKNGIDREAPVQLRPVNSGPDFGARYGFEPHSGWSAMTGRHRGLTLGPAGSLVDGAADSPDGSAAGPGEAAQRISTGLDSLADSGVPALQQNVQAALGAQQPVPMAALRRPLAAVWKTAPSPRSQHVRGTARARLHVTPTAQDGTLVAYLYDVDRQGLGRLITHAPYSFRDRTPGTAFTADFPLLPTAYDVPAGHRVALVVDAADSHYVSDNPPLAGMTLASAPSAPSAPSSVSVPLR
ncbi:CocE/NonD family hydrolase [Streptomyces sp. NPDC003032]